MRLGRHRGQGQRRGNSKSYGSGADIFAPPGNVAAPEYNLPQKENGISILWDTTNDRPAEDMFPFRTPPQTTGTVHSVPGVKTLTQALIDCNPANFDVIEIAAGTVSTGNFVLPDKSWTSGYVTIRTSNHASLPANGSRIAVADASNMATIRCTNTNGIALTAAASASHFYFIGIIFTNESGVNNEDNAICSFTSAAGGGWSSKTTAPNNIHFDRCRWKPQGASMQKRGFYVAGKNISFYGCRFDGFDDGGGGQGQCIATSEYVQRLHIENCFIGAASQHMIWGGSGLGTLDGGYDNVHPQDIIIWRNEFKGDGSLTLNRTCMYETKNSERVVVGANVFHGYRISAVGTHELLLNIGAQESNPALANYIKCRHQTIRGNLFYDCEGSIISVHGNNGTPANEVGNHVEFSYNYGWSYPAGGSGAGRAFQYFVRSCYDVLWRNNTIRGWPHSNIHIDELGAAPGGLGPRWFNNAFPHDSTYGFFRTGIKTMDQLYNAANWRFSHNAEIDNPNEHVTMIPGGTPDNTGTNQTLANIAAFGFTSESTNVYSLAVGSPLLLAGSDGRNIGGHWSTFQANINGVETG